MWEKKKYCSYVGGNEFFHQTNSRQSNARGAPYKTAKGKRKLMRLIAEG